VLIVSGFVLRPGEGRAYDFHGSVVVIKAASSDTAGQLAVMESSYPAGLSVGAHVHAGEDEMFYLLEGELSGFCDDEQWTATAGSFVFVPRDRPHGFIVVGDRPARAVVVTGPPHLDAQIAARGPSTSAP
jgi:quercetin dioxygenase-like cupin family protein